MAHDEQWLTPRLQTAATLCNQTPAATASSGISSVRSPLFVAISTLLSSNSVFVLAMRRLHFLQVRTRVFPSTCWNLLGWK